MKNIGLHLRFKKIITEVLEQAIELNIKTFQCFFSDSINKRSIQLDATIIESFKRLAEKFSDLYAHGSYLINLADERDHYILKREIELSKRLGFKYLILHPGAFKPAYQTLEKGLDVIVKNLNNITKVEKDIVLVLENTAFGGNVIGGDLTHFDSIFTRLDFPERVKFCIDTAHAYAYGYDLNDTISQDDFIQILKNSVIKENIQLLHLNNNNEALGSRIDSHAVLSEGKIALENLKRFAQDSLLSSIDIIIEMPEASKEIKIDILNKVTHWFN